MAFRWNGQEFDTPEALQRAKRLHALESIVQNRGIRSRLWNLLAGPERRAQAKKNYESMLQGGSGITRY